MTENNFIQSHNKTFGGNSVHYLEAGPQEGLEFVLLHGASFSSATWKEIGTISLLAEAGFHVIAMDLPGFGRSESTSYAKEKWLQDWLVSLNISKPILLAASMSGGFAFPFINANPDCILGFVAIAPVSISRYKEIFSQISAPVLAVWGEKDRLIPLAEAELLVSNVQQGELVIVPNGSHAPYMSDPKFFHQTLIKFLNEKIKK